MMTLREVAAEMSRRLSRIFLRDDDGRRPVFGGQEMFQSDPHWRDLILFHEYFHGDNGARRRRKPPDRLDGARREAAAAERGVAVTASAVGILDVKFSTREPRAASREP